MDKYEYSLRLDQMKSLFAEEKYEDAAEIADTINWNKVKNVNALVKAGEVYEKMERYEDSRDVLLMAYDRSPIGRMIIYRLAEVAIKMKDFQAAEDYYQEFVEIAPHDTLKYVLRYDIKKAQGAPYTELIPILEELKDQEYTEEWAYELAYLYHKAGMSEKCIEACDELILWFGDGPYVERALELKMLYQPLTKTQEDKYRAFRQAKDSRSAITHIDVSEMQRAGEYAHDPVTIPKVELNVERFNTVNLQQEIAKGMQQIMEATEKETVSDTMESINKMVEEIPYLKLPQEGSEGEQENIHIETDEEIDGSLKTNFQEMLGEDSDGQMSLMMNDKLAVEHQITGQITIDEVLNDWEKTKRAAEAALEDAKQRKLESAKARALQEAETLMDRLTGVMPKLDAGVTPRELLEEEYLQNLPEHNNIENVVSEPAMELEGEPISEPLIEPEEEMIPVPLIEPEEEMIPEPLTEPEEEVIPAALMEPEEELVPEQAMASGEEMIPVPLIEPETEDDLGKTKRLPDVDIQGFEEVPMEELPEKPTLEQEREEEFAFVRKHALPESEHSRGRKVRLSDIPVPEDLGKDDPEGKEPPVVALTDEQKAIFSYFMPVKGMEEQLCLALSKAARHLQADRTASTGNLIIQGGQGCGKTTLATSVIKVLQQETGHPKGKIGKIHASALNQKDIEKLLGRVADGCLIIEQAGDMNRQTVSVLSHLMSQDQSGLFVILEDTSKGIKRLFAMDGDFAEMFTETISVPIFTNDELVTFARSYARELGYKIDDLAVLALYNRISSIQRFDQATTLTEVKEIVDEAIRREAHGGFKKMVSILTASRYTDDDRIVLNEKDFE
ncbi:MAG: hypothetical protein MR508_04795 [Lachnospiraceae bacterium]|nr:hypothetical protein [Lachnospiraceae bacterium]